MSAIDPGPGAAFGGELYHTGIIVRDLDAAMELYGPMSGGDWVTSYHGGNLRIGENEEIYREARVAHSRRGPHYLELIQYTHPALSERFAEFGPPHHLGYFVDDLDAAVETLTASGCPQRWHGGTGDRSFSYHCDPNGGLWLELVSSGLRLDIERWIGQGVAIVPQLEDAEH